MTKQFLVILFMGLLLTSCGKQKRAINFPKTNITQSHLIPMPLSVVADSSGFALDKFSTIITSDEEGFKQVGLFLASNINSKTSLDIKVNDASLKNVETVIAINQTKKESLNKFESYELIISNDTIALNSNSVEGAFRGIQTIRQLIPYTSNDTLANNKIWVVPTGKIVDAPQFEYRGTMLDVSRHFFSVEDVKKYIDVLSYYKYNILHLHLSDDQGWRIEIKSWPKLTEIGGSTEVGGEAGGFYTQEQYKDIIKYAAARHITIVPEIDMPGHTNAASVSYPFLNGNGKKLK